VPVSVFVAYSHRDDDLRKKIEAHFAAMKRSGLISTWSDQLIRPGNEWEREIGDQLETADVILLLISSDFLESTYCYEKEMKRALERHDSREASVIPVIVRPCDWQSSPVGKLQALPNDGQPLTTWPNLDEGILDVVAGVREVATEISAERAATKSSEPPLSRVIHTAAYQFRSANLTLAPGDSGTFSTFYANVGTSVWERGTATETGLLFVNRSPRMLFWALGWANDVVLALQTKDKVTPGDFTPYTFNFRVPEDAKVPSTEMFICQPMMLAGVPLLLGEQQPFFVFVRAREELRT